MFSIAQIKNPSERGALVGQVLVSPSGVPEPSPSVEGVASAGVAGVSPSPSKYVIMMRRRKYCIIV